jgi:hypothetical protein
MASVTQNFMKLFRGSSGGTEAATAQPAAKLTRRSSGLGELSRLWEGDSPLCVLDLGSTSPANIRFFTEGSHKIYSEDLLVASTEPHLVTKDETGAVVLDSRRFLPTTWFIPRRISTWCCAGICLTIWMKAWCVRSWDGCGRC